MNNQLLFQVTNRHREASGVPPHIDEQTFSGVYRGSFENQNGEQAIFLYEYEQERGTLFIGDAGWEHPYGVVDGKVADPLQLHFFSSAVMTLREPKTLQNDLLPDVTRCTWKTTQRVTPERGK